MKDNSTAPSRRPHVAKRRHRGSARARARFLPRRPQATRTKNSNRAGLTDRAHKMGDAPALDPSKSGHHVPLAELGRLKAKSITRVTGIENQMIHGNAPFLSVPRPSRGTLQKMQQLKREIIIRLCSRRRRPSGALYRAHARPSGRRYTVEHSTPRTTATVRRDLDLTSDTTTPAARAANITCNRQPMTSDLHLMRQSDRARVRRTHAKTIIIERKPRHSTGKIAATTAARPTRHRQSK